MVTADSIAATMNDTKTSVGTLLAFFNVPDGTPGYVEQTMSKIASPKKTVKTVEQEKVASSKRDEELLASSLAANDNLCA